MSCLVWIEEINKTENIPLKPEGLAFSQPAVNPMVKKTCTIPIPKELTNSAMMYNIDRRFLGMIMQGWRDVHMVYLIYHP
jgi:hypothetical protein